MPYFPSIKTLFIHIPKTGGTSIENYFQYKLNIKLELHGEDKKINNHSYQHLTYNEIYDNMQILDNILFIFSIVRNPYERIISDLFFLKLINKDMDSNMVENVINKFLNSSYIYDNHKIPQYLFLIDKSGNINNNIKILKTESLNSDMHKLGYTDFDLHVNQSFKNEVNYYNYLNKHSIQQINDYYSKDFEIFNYYKLTNPFSH